MLSRQPDRRRGPWRKSPSSAPIRKSSPGVEGNYTGGYYEEEDEEDEGSGHGKTAIIVVSILLAIVVIAGIVMWKVFLSPSDDGMVSVPNFLGQKIESVLGNEMYSDFNLEEGDSVYSSD